MATPIDIKAALLKLDVSNDNHWTAEGLPRLDTVKMLVGDQSVTREQATQAIPGFTRIGAVQPVASERVTPTTAPVMIAVPIAAQSAPEALLGDPELERLWNELQDAKNVYQDMSVYKGKFEREYAEQAAKVDKLNAAYEKLVPPETITDAVQGYHESRKVQMAVQAEKAKNWKALNLNLRDIVPQKAPVDAIRNTRRRRSA